MRAFTKLKEMFSGKRDYFIKYCYLTGFHMGFLKIVKNILFDFIKFVNFPKIDHSSVEHEWLILNRTRPEKTDCQTRPDETRQFLNPTRPDFLKKFQTRPDPIRKFF